MRQLNMKKKTIRYYISQNGKAPFKEWINNIKDPVTKARIFRRLDRVALGNGVYELRFTFGSGYRIYFAEEGDVTVILLLGGDKSQQSKDIVAAKGYWDELRGVSND
jgi:putative addiction module killer protein